MTPKEYGQFVEKAGQLSKPVLDRVIGGPVWKGLDLDARQDLVSDIMKQSRKQARDELFVPGGIIISKKDKESDPWSQFKDAR